jgi:hypothetical protein
MTQTDFWIRREINKRPKITSNLNIFISHPFSRLFEFMVTYITLVFSPTSPSFHSFLSDHFLYF